MYKHIHPPPQSPAKSAPDSAYIVTIHRRSVTAAPYFSASCHSFGGRSPPHNASVINVSTSTPKFSHVFRDRRQIIPTTPPFGINTFLLGSAPLCLTYIPHLSLTGRTHSIYHGQYCAMCFTITASPLIYSLLTGDRELFPSPWSIIPEPDIIDETVNNFKRS